jgi:ABC-type spermidine/putrescine transport system permease subunit I
MTGPVARSPSSARTWLRDAVLAGPVVVLLAVLVAVPLGLLAFRSVVGVEGPTAAGWGRLVSSPIFLPLLGKSLRLATVVTVITTALAWPAGWAISRTAARHRPVLLGLVVVPYLTSYLLLIYAVLVLISPGGPLMSTLGALGLADPRTSFLYTPRATTVMLVYEHLPIMIIVLAASSERIPASLLEAARSLGARRLTVVRRVVLPLTLPGLAAGFALVFVPVAGSFVEAQILGGPDGLLFGNIIADQVTRVNDPMMAAVLSLTLLTAVIIVLVALQALRVGLAAVARRRSRPSLSVPTAAEAARA